MLSCLVIVVTNVLLLLLLILDSRGLRVFWSCFIELSRICYFLHVEKVSVLIKNIFVSSIKVLERSSCLKPSIASINWVIELALNLGSSHIILRSRSLAHYIGTRSCYLRIATCRRRKLNSRPKFTGNKVIATVCSCVHSFGSHHMSILCLIISLF